MRQSWKKLPWIAAIMLLLSSLVAVTACSQKKIPEDTQQESAGTNVVEMTTASEILQEKTEELTTAEESSEAQTEEEVSDYVSPIDFDSLLEENPDVVAWIRIDDTNIDYPILQTDDNGYYLYRDFYGNDSQSGSIYLDFESEADFGGRHNIIYGHRMRNGSMFRDVINFRQESFFKSHPYFSIYTPEREIRLKVISCFYSESNYMLRWTHFTSQSNFDRYVASVLSQCPYAEQVEFPVRSIYTLITCSYEVNDARTMLVAVEVDENGDVIPPDEKFLEHVRPAELASEHYALKRIRRRTVNMAMQ